MEKRKTPHFFLKWNGPSKMGFRDMLQDFRVLNYFKNPANFGKFSAFWKNGSGKPPKRRCAFLSYAPQIFGCITNFRMRHKFLCFCYLEYFHHFNIVRCELPTFLLDFWRILGPWKCSGGKFQVQILMVLGKSGVSFQVSFSGFLGLEIGLRFFQISCFWTWFWVGFRVRFEIQSGLLRILWFWTIPAHQKIRALWTRFSTSPGPPGVPRKWVRSGFLGRFRSIWGSDFGSFLMVFGRFLGRFVGISGRSGRDLAGAFGPVWVSGSQVDGPSSWRIWVGFWGLGCSELGPQGRLGRGSFK